MSFPDSQLAAITPAAPAVGAEVVAAGVDWVPSGGPTSTRGLSVAVAGDILADFADGRLGVLLPNVQPGDHPYCVTKIFAAGTTATGIVAFY